PDVKAGPLADGAAVQPGLVVPRDAATLRKRTARVGVHHRAFLHVAAFAHDDGFVVAAQYGTGPYAGIGGQTDIADDGRFHRDISAVIDSGCLVSEPIAGHVVSVVS